MIDKGKYIKRASKCNCTKCEYPVQNNVDENHIGVLTFCGAHVKIHGVRGLSKHYHLKLDPKLGHEIF